MNDQATAIAKALLGKFEIGVFRRLADVPADYDDATTEEIAAVIRATVAAPFPVPEEPTPPVEIVDPQGVVSYRRPHGHADIAEALRRPGYHVRLTLPPEFPQGGEQAWRLAFQLLGIPLARLQSDEHAFGLDRITRRMYVWPSWYTPTPDEIARAKTWANGSND